MKLLFFVSGFRSVGTLGRYEIFLNCIIQTPPFGLKALLAQTILIRWIKLPCCFVALLGYKRSVQMNPLCPYFFVFLFYLNTWRRKFSFFHILIYPFNFSRYNF
jgi:hypothetical protein